MPAVLGKKPVTDKSSAKIPEYREYAVPSVDDIINDIHSEESDLISVEEVDRNAVEFAKKHKDTIKDKFRQERKKSFKSARKRLFEAVVSIALILLVGVFMFLLLYPQTELSELSSDNSDLKDEIAVLRKQIVDSEENMNGIMDMESIRAQALTLGMQDPNANQVISIPMPKRDKLVTVVTYDDYGVSEDAYKNALANLADYYIVKALNSGEAS
ncbi:MAG: hypothetical protein IKN14_07250 [Clostridiales bacterium]|nr:hypothetical protein [Clostridiales bacterium]